MNFTKEEIIDYADKLLIGLTEEEVKMVLDEFEIIDKNIDLINKISNIDEGKVESIGNYDTLEKTSKVFKEFVDSQKREVA